MNSRIMPWLFVIALAIFGVFSSAFIVNQREAVIVFQLGEIRDVVTQPGLHFRIPFVQNIKRFDRRILTIDAEDPTLFNTRDKQNVKIDSYVKWRITDVKRYYQSFGSDELMAANRLQQNINNALYAEIGKRTQDQVIGAEREVVMKTVRERVDAEVRRMGVQIVDVRLKRVDYPEQVSDSVYQRMNAERQQAANKLRAEGEALNLEKKAAADRQRNTTLAEAYRKAQEIKGQSDAEAAAIYAEAYGRDPEFARFFRSLQAYRQSQRKGDTVVLRPDSGFYRYFKSGDKP